MGARRYLLVSGIIFAIVAAGHAIRAFNHWSLEINGWSAPIWPSWVAAVGAGILCVWALASRRR